MEAAPQCPGDQALGVLEGRGTEDDAWHAKHKPRLSRLSLSNCRHRSQDLPTNRRCRPGGREVHVWTCERAAKTPLRQHLDQTGCRAVPRSRWHRSSGDRRTPSKSCCSGSRRRALGAGSLSVPVFSNLAGTGPAPWPKYKRMSRNACTHFTRLELEDPQLSSYRSCRTPEAQSQLS